MVSNTPSWFQRVRRDQIFWLVVVGLLLIYALSRLNVVSFLLTAVALILAITVHECAHAWVADRLGDPTARYLGRVSLNPLVHLDPVGTAMMLVTALTGMGIGWGKPVPVSPHRLRYGQRLGSGLVALAGPVANLVLAALCGLVLRLAGGRWTALDMVLSTIVVTNIVIAMFNLLPLPPLDGHSVLLGLLSLLRGEWAWRVADFVQSWQRLGPMFLILLIVFSQFLGINILGWWIGPPLRFFYRLFVGS
jgi:Zn-dependent protease